MMPGFMRRRPSPSPALSLPGRLGPAALACVLALVPAASAAARSAATAPASLEVRVTAGGFFGGSRVSTQGVLRGRLGESFNAWVDFSRDDASLPTGRFVTNLPKARLSFPPRLYVQALVQYNDVIDDWSTNLRPGWLQTANTGLFVVYNENRATDHDPLGLGVRDCSLTIKYSRLFDLLD